MRPALRASRAFDDLSDMREALEIIRSGRRSIAVEIRPDLRVVVRAPRHMRDADIACFLQKQAAWIAAHTEIMRQRIAARKERRQPPLSAAEIAALTADARTVIPARVAHFAPIVGVRYGEIHIRHQKSRWGSCSAKGNLNFNCLLMLCPPEVLDYVVVHELCHRLEMNHSPRFWAAVERVMPAYAVPKNWLKENGSRLIERLQGVDNDNENEV